MAEQYLFPFFQDEVEDAVGNEIVKDDIYKDVAWDYEHNIPVILNGDFLIVEGLEAVKSWAYRALQTQRVKYEIFTWDYGLDIESYVGKVLTDKNKIDLAKEIEECLLQNKHITGVTNLELTTEKRKVYINFKIVTKYGELDEVVILDEAI